MHRTKVVSLGQVRDLLAEWNKVREMFVAGSSQGFALTLMAEDATETVYLGGIFKDCPQKALSASMKMSAARALTEDEPPLFQVSQF